MVTLVQSQTWSSDGDMTQVFVTDLTLITPYRLHIYMSGDVGTFLGAATGSPYIVFIYIVKYRQSIAFRYIYIGGHSSVACEGESHKQTSESCTSRRLLSFWTPLCVHYMSTSGLFTLLPLTRDRNNNNLEKRVVLFAACLVCDFPTFNLCSTAENNRQE